MSKVLRVGALVSVTAAMWAITATGPAFAAPGDDVWGSQSPICSPYASQVGAYTSARVDASPTVGDTPADSTEESSDGVILRAPWVGPDAPAGGIVLPATAAAGSGMTVNAPASYAGTTVDIMMFVASSDFSGPCTFGWAVPVGATGDVVVRVPADRWAVGPRAIYVTPAGGSFQDPDVLIGWGRMEIVAAAPEPTPDPQPSNSPDPVEPSPDPSPVSPASPAPAPSPASPAPTVVASPSRSMLAASGVADTAPTIAVAALVAIALGAVVAGAARRRRC